MKHNKHIKKIDLNEKKTGIPACLFIFCAEYDFNHIQNKKPLDKYVDKYYYLLEQRWYSSTIYYDHDIDKDTRPTCNKVYDNPEKYEGFDEELFNMEHTPVKYKRLFAQWKDLYYKILEENLKYCETMQKINNIKNNFKNK